MKTYAFFSIVLIFTLYSCGSSREDVESREAIEKAERNAPHINAVISRILDDGTMAAKIPRERIDPQTGLPDSLERIVSVHPEIKRILTEEGARLQEGAFVTLIPLPQKDIPKGNGDYLIVVADISYMRVYVR